MGPHADGVAMVAEVPLDATATSGRELLEQAMWEDHLDDFVEGLSDGDLRLLRDYLEHGRELRGFAELVFGLVTLQAADRLGKGGA